MKCKHSNYMMATIYIFCLDYPVIISNDSCQFLDPQGKLWSKQYSKKCKLDEVSPGVLEPFAIAGFNKECLFFNSSSYFRFPLRTVPSSLSNTTFSISHIHDLIKNFRRKANYLLLFLRSLKSIEIHEIRSSTSNVELVCKIHRHGPSPNLCKISSKHTETFHVYTQVQDSDYQDMKSEYLVSMIFGSNNSEITNLGKQLHLSPSVGVAINLTSSTSTGELFSFLPLSAEDSNPFQFFSYSWKLCDYT